MTSLACEVQNVSSKPTNKTNSIISTSCSQNPSGGSNSGSSDPKQQWDAEIESCYRAGTCRAYARRMAAKCGLDVEDLLHRAIVRALDRGSRGLSAQDRIHECIQSLASTDARAAVRARTNGSLGTIDPATVADVTPGSEFARSDRVLERMAARRTTSAICEEAAGGDPTQAALIDCLGDGLRGADITNALGIDETELATRRKRLKRTVDRLCGPYNTDEGLDFGPLLAMKAESTDDLDGQNLNPRGFIC